LIYILTVVAYLLNAGLYLAYNPALRIIYTKHQVNAWYFGSEGLFMCAFIILAMNAKWWYEKKLIQFAVGFIFARTILYLLNDLSIWTDQGRYRMFILSVVTLVFVVLFIKNGRKYGFIHRD